MGSSVAPASPVAPMRAVLACPSCGADVRFWRFLAAPTPLHLRCGVCRTRLIVPNAGRIIAWYLVSIIPSAIGALVLAQWGRPGLAIAAVGVLVATALAAEVFVFRMLVRRRLPLVARNAAVD